MNPTQKPQEAGVKADSAPLGIIASFAAGVPQRAIVKVGKFLGLLAWAVDNRHRRIVRRNLRFTHPEWPKDRVRTLTRRVFQNTGITFLEVCQIPYLTPDQIVSRLHVRGMEHLIAALDNPRGAIMISAHVGNWEMAPLLACCRFGKPMAAVARRLRNPFADRWLHRLRTRFGNIIIDKKRALPHMVRVLRRGMMLGILIDQGTKLSEGVEVDFFGRKVTATPAAALLARRYKVPVFPSFCVREPDGRLTIMVEPPLVLRKTEDPRSDLETHTQIMTDAVERVVRAYPDQWFWFHKRWKRHYPRLYKEDFGRRRLRKMKEKARLMSGRA
jgi:KDO2-lipid IV(A) lauroyltransferase